MFNIIYLFQVLSELRKFVTIVILNIEKEHFNELGETGWLSSAIDHDGERGLSQVPFFSFFQVNGCKGHTQMQGERRGGKMTAWSTPSTCSGLQAAVVTTVVSTSCRGKAPPLAWLTGHARQSSLSTSTG